MLYRINCYTIFKSSGNNPLENYYTWTQSWLITKKLNLKPWVGQINNANKLHSIRNHTMIWYPKNLFLCTMGCSDHCIHTKTWQHSMNNCKHCMKLWECTKTWAQVISKFTPQNSIIKCSKIKYMYNHPNSFYKIYSGSITELDNNNFHVVDQKNPMVFFS